jgi:hypothetical protein
MFAGRAATNHLSTITMKISRARIHLPGVIVVEIAIVAAVEVVVVVAVKMIIIVILDLKRDSMRGTNNRSTHKIFNF